MLSSVRLLEGVPCTPIGNIEAASKPRRQVAIITPTSVPHALSSASRVLRALAAEEVVELHKRVGEASSR